MEDLSFKSYDLKYDPEAQRMLERRRRQELAEAEAAAAQSVQSAAPPITPVNPPPVQEASPAAKPAVPSASPAPKKRKRGRPANEKADVQIRIFPRELWEAMKMALPFPELDTYPDYLIAFALFHLDPNVKFPTYKPPAHITQAVKRMREALSGSDIQALGATMGQIRSKMNKFDDEMLQQRMLLAYALAVISGLHAPGRVNTGKDLKLSHENVISTAISALEAFPEFKQVIRDHEGRPRRGVSQQNHRE